MVKQPNQRSTQPSVSNRWDTLYCITTHLGPENVWHADILVLHFIALFVTLRRKVDPFPLSPSLTGMRIHFVVADLLESRKVFAVRETGMRCEMRSMWCNENIYGEDRESEMKMTLEPGK